MAIVSRPSSPEYRDGWERVFRGSAYKQIEAGLEDAIRMAKRMAKEVEPPIRISGSGEVSTRDNGDGTTTLTCEESGWFVTMPTKKLEELLSGGHDFSIGKDGTVKFVDCVCGELRPIAEHILCPVHGHLLCSDPFCNAS